MSSKSQIVLRAEESSPSFEVNYGTDPAKSSLLKKNPFVPAGAMLTAGVLFGGLVAFKKGNAGLSQRLMRARIFAQGGTLAVLAASVATVGKAERE